MARRSGGTASDSPDITLLKTVLKYINDQLLYFYVRCFSNKTIPSPLIVFLDMLLILVLYIRLKLSLQ